MLDRRIGSDRENRGVSTEMIPEEWDEDVLKRFIEENRMYDDPETEEFVNKMSKRFGIGELEKLKLKGSKLVTGWERLNRLVELGVKNVEKDIDYY